jgi:hypothetical protein
VGRGGGEGVTFHNEKKAVSQFSEFTCLKKAIESLSFALYTANGKRQAKKNFTVSGNKE